MGGKLSKSKKSAKLETNESDSPRVHRVLSGTYDMVTMKGYSAVEDEYRVIFAKDIGPDVDPDEIPLDFDLFSLHTLDSDEKRTALLAQLTSQGQDFSKYTGEIFDKLSKIDAESAASKKI